MRRGINPTTKKRKEERRKEEKKRRELKAGRPHWAYSCLHEPQVGAAWNQPDMRMETGTQTNTRIAVSISSDRAAITTTG